MTPIKKSNLKNLIILISLDLAGVSFSFFGAYLIKFRVDSGNLLNCLAAYQVYWKIFLFNSFLWLLILNLFGLYQLEKKERIVSFFYIFLGTTSGLFISLVATFIYPEFSYAKIILIEAWIMASFILFFLRYFFKETRLK